MSKLLLRCGTFALTVGSALFAQSRPAAPAPQGEKAVAGVVASIVVTGCLERWADTASSGTAAAKGPAGAEYMITHVDGETTPPRGSAAGERTAPEARYLLMSSLTMNYAAHLNHTVKVVGTIAPQPSEGASADDQSAEPSRSETNLPAGPTSEAYRMNLVEVATLAMVSRTCAK